VEELEPVLVRCKIGVSGQNQSPAHS
jgi:hypothetical protein